MSSPRSAIPYLLAALLFCLSGWVILAGGDLFEVISYDGPWHLACGRLIVETGAVPHSDPFCFTSEGVRWQNLNWLT